MAALAAAVASSVAGVGTGAALASPRPVRAPIHHVWVIQLENQGYAATFGNPTADPYLARTLPSEGALLTQYFGTGHESNDNYIAQVSGQAANPQNQADCQVFTDFLPPLAAVGPDGQALGSGCVYPASISTIGNQITSRGLTWKAYEQDMGNNPARDMTDSTGQGPACGHPALDSHDGTQTATASDQYASRHDPFVYFHSVIDDRAYCDAHVVSFQPLQSDLATVATTSNYSYLTPNLCNDGHDSPCADGQPGGLAQVDAFLAEWVPRIMASPAYRADGLIVVTFDEAATSDATACCGESDPMAHPDSPEPGVTGPGGGRVGAVLLSPFIAPGTVSATPYNHYSLLRSVEDIFGVAHLGDAGQAGVTSFGPDVYTAPARAHAPGRVNKPESRRCS